MKKLNQDRHYTVKTQGEDIMKPSRDFITNTIVTISKEHFEEMFGNDYRMLTPNTYFHYFEHCSNVDIFVEEFELTGENVVYFKNDESDIGKFILIPNKYILDYMRLENELYDLLATHNFILKHGRNVFDKPPTEIVCCFLDETVGYKINGNFINLELDCGEEINFHLEKNIEYDGDNKEILNAWDYKFLTRNEVYLLLKDYELSDGYNVLDYEESFEIIEDGIRFVFDEESLTIEIIGNMLDCNESKCFKLIRI